MRGAAPLLGPLLLAGCIPRVTGVVRPPEIPLATLEEKAGIWQRDLENHHLSPEGLLLYDGPTEARELGAPLPRIRYGGLSDQAAWTGCLLAAEAWRHDATGEEEARVAARRTASALLLLQRVTGEPGYVARGAFEGPPFDARFQRGAPPFERFSFRGDSSRDQYAMVLFGFATALARSFDEELRRGVAAAVGPISDHIFSNDLEIREKGRRTTHGNLSGRVLGLFANGVNAGVVLLAAKLAAEATGEGRHAQRYADLVRDGWPGRVGSGFYRILGIGNFDNDNMTLLCLDGLLSLERDPEIREAYLAGLERGWGMVRGNGNALFAAIVHRHLGAQATEAFEEAVASLRLFPTEKIRYATDNRDLLPILGRRCLPGTDFRARTKRAVPVHRQPPGSFIWTSDPFRVVEDPGARGANEYAGVDYLLPYWMLRGTGLRPNA